MAESMENVEVSETFPVTATTLVASQNGKLAYFDVEKKIGKGQFSEVYRAKYKMNDGLPLALKKVQVEKFVLCCQSFLSSCVQVCSSFVSFSVLFEVQVFLFILCFIHL